MTTAEKLTSAAKGFITSFSETLETNNLSDFSEPLQQIETTTIQRGPVPRLQHPTLDYLHSLAEQITNPQMHTAVKHLDWGQVYQGGGIENNLAEGMFAAQAAGTYGVYAAQNIATGLFLLAPNVFYPLHTHAAREVYHCLAGEIEIIHRVNDAAFTLHTNQSSETPSGRLHSLRTGAAPVLLAYIWTGDITAPTWWWERNESGNWIRTAWQRKPGESWKAARTELVDDIEYSRAIA